MKQHSLIHYLVCLLLIFPSSLVLGQTGFQREYNFGNYQAASVEPFGTGYFVAGSSNARSLRGYDGCLTRLASDGSVVWSKFFGGSEDDRFTALRRTANGQLAVLGITRSFASGGNDLGNLYVLLLDSNGTVLRSKSIGTSRMESAIGLEQTADQGFIIVATSNDLGVMRPYVVKTDANLDVEWSRLYENGDYYNSEATSVVALRGGGYALTGFSYTSTPQIARHLFVMVTDSMGLPTLSKHFSYLDTQYGNREAGGYDLIQNSDGDLVVAGSVGGVDTINPQLIYHPLLLQIDLNGNVVYSKFFANTAVSNAASVRQTPDGGYILGGTMGGDYLAMLKTTPTITTEWCYYYDQNTSRPGSGNCVRLTPDGGFVLAGKTLFDDAVQVVKADALGQTTCQQTVPIGGGASSPVTLGMTSPPWTTTAGADTAAAPTTVETGLVDATLNCMVVGVAPAHQAPALRCYPNPGMDLVWVEVTGAAQLIVTNLCGQIMVSRVLDRTITERLQLDVADWAAGVYIIRTGSIMQKLVKE